MPNKILLRWMSVAVLLAITLTWFIADDSDDGVIADPSTLQSSLREYAARLASANGCSNQTVPELIYRFPQDFAPHDGARTEYWGLSTIMSDSKGNRYGIRLRLAQLAVTSCDAALPDSDWAYSHVMGVSGTVFDLSESMVHSAEQLSRVALGFAGASGKRVWLDTWTLQTNRVGKCALEFAAKAPATNMNFELRFESSQCPVSTSSGDAAGQSIHSYIVQSPSVTGFLTKDDEKQVLTGHGWLERLWGQPPISSGPIVWDQLTFSTAQAGAGKISADESESTRRHISLLRSRRRDGTGTPIVSGLIIEADGSTATLDNDDVTLTVHEQKRLLRKSLYRWSLAIPRLNLQAQVNPVLAQRDKHRDEAGLNNWSGLVDIQYTGEQATDYGYFDLER